MHGVGGPGKVDVVDVDGVEDAREGDVEGAVGAFGLHRRVGGHVVARKGD